MLKKSFILLTAVTLCACSVLRTKTASDKRLPSSIDGGGIKHVGNGGWGVVCQEAQTNPNLNPPRTVEVLDLYEGRKVAQRTYDTTIFDGDESRAWKLIKERTSNYFYYTVKNRYEKLSANFHPINPKEDELPQTTDALPAIQPINCKFVQIASYDDDIVLYDPTYFNLLSKFHKKVLALHEAIYYILRQTKKSTTSDGARKLVATLLANEWDQRSQNTLNEYTWVDYKTPCIEFDKELYTFEQKVHNGAEFEKKEATNSFYFDQTFGTDRSSCNDSSSQICLNDKRIGNNFDLSMDPVHNFVGPINWNDKKIYFASGSNKDENGKLIAAFFWRQGYHSQMKLADENYPTNLPQYATFKLQLGPRILSQLQNTCFDASASFTGEISNIDNSNKMKIKYNTSNPLIRLLDLINGLEYTCFLENGFCKKENQVQ